MVNLKLRPTAKAQLEILGVVVIVILIIIIMFAFVLKKANIEDRQSNLDMDKVQSGLTSLAASTTKCGPELATLIKNCYTGNDLKCEDMKACDYVRQKSQELLSDAFKARAFLFTAAFRGATEIEVTSSDLRCTETMDSFTAKQYLPTSSGNVILTLKLCKK